MTTVTAAQHASSNASVSKVGGKGGKHAHFHWAKEPTTAEFFFVFVTTLLPLSVLSVCLSCEVSKVSKVLTECLLQISKRESVKVRKLKRVCVIFFFPTQSDVYVHPDGDGCGRMPRSA